ncbi:MAG: UDP-glucose/GDP-mannose dehydrogenase family protein [Candidatus Omnitrophota bacterium]
MKIAIIGTGYVGLVTGACLSELGNEVCCVDSDKKKISSLEKGVIPIYEPGLEKMVKRNKKEGRLTFVSSIKQGVEASLVVFICVGTPSKESGEPDLLVLERVVQEIAGNLHSYKVIVEKSTVPVDTGQWVKKTLETFSCGEKRGLTKKRCQELFSVASNPEFLREGSAIKDFMNPDRIVIGVESQKAKKILLKLYSPLKAPVVVTDIKSAEIIKHASNSFLASKISFINAVSTICEKAGADIKQVAEGIGLDRRIGRHFLDAGVGFGGSCFPKDISAFIYIAKKIGYDFTFLKEVAKINEDQKARVLDKIAKLIWNISGKTIGVLGLAFKPNTDDIRSAPAIDIIKKLLDEGVMVRAYDPKAMKGTRAVFGDKIKYCKDPYEAARGCDCLLFLTEWDEFKKLDFDKIKELLKQPAIVDGRNIYDPAKMKKLGFSYEGIGRR